MLTSLVKRVGAHHGSAHNPYLFILLMNDLLTGVGEWAPQFRLFADAIAQMVENWNWKPN